jgi:TIR domain
VCARLESAGIRCWIAPRDIVAGTSYGEAIIDAIHSVKVMVLVFSSNANSSGHIPKEVERAVSNGVAIIPFRIEDVAPGKSLDYFIGSVHWLDAMTPPLENHLDNLAETVHKLLPAKAGAARAAGPGSGVWQRSTPAAEVAAPVSPAPAAMGSATGGAPARASSSKNVWIAVAALAVLAVAGVGVMMLRGGAASPGGGTNLLPVLKNGGDPIVGCYQWFNNAPVMIHADGTMLAGPFTGRWAAVNAGRRSYTFTWPEATDTVTISPNQRSLSGGNQYGYPASGTRISGTAGLVGLWRWPNGVPVTIQADGGFSAGPFRGRWKAIDASRGIYTLTWPNPVDSVELSADGSRVSGANQYGVAISGVRTESCAAN